MTSIGETLRGERLRRNLELDRISNDLKISTKLLEAMEADRFDKLPGGVFTRSFVRQYARLLGLDDEEIAASLQRMLEPPSVQPEVPETTEPALPSVVLPRVKNWLPEGNSASSWSSSLKALALVVFVVLICAAVYSWLQRGPRFAAVPSNAPVVAHTPKPQQPVPVASGKTQPTAAVSPLVEAGSAERVAAPVRVQLTAEEPVWILAETDGKFAFSGTLEANQSRIIEASDRVLLKLGNAGGLIVWLNGKALAPLGARGEVRRVQFTSGGFQIVPVDAATPGDSGRAPVDSGRAPGESPSETLAPL